MSDSNPNVANDTIRKKPAVVVAIEDASRRAHEREVRKAARWVEATAWRFTDADFEDILAAEYLRLHDDDRIVLREFRERVTAERCAAA
jgi:hypothetical protein